MLLHPISIIPPSSSEKTSHRHHWWMWQSLIQSLQHCCFFQEFNNWEVCLVWFDESAIELVSTVGCVAFYYGSVNHQQSLQMSMSRNKSQQNKFTLLWFKFCEVLKRLTQSDLWAQQETVHCLFRFKLQLFVAENFWNRHLCKSRYVLLCALTIRALTGSKILTWHVTCAEQCKCVRCSKWGNIKITNSKRNMAKNH